ncbi:Alkaline phosphatase homologues [Clostridium bornimense]|uniref:Alkaline phosphatase homologues n=1 Tax=Clostridium bornimense TaxID=1216932 RepID=W6RYJ8_9CLOT|nr:alkaline phosphatase [Clostridium bornimense]CDM69523.1 Alkaline phosphatase homologues [Clostridium bornimense]
MSKKLTILLSTIIVGSMLTMSLSNNVKLDTANAAEGEDKNVIMLMADGMSQEAITLARYYKDAQDGKYGNDTLAMDEIASGATHTAWANGPVTDSAPGGTAYATGNKTNDKYVATSTEDKPLATILEGAKLEGKGTGIVMTCEVPHATPADFTAHTNTRSDYKSILSQQISNDLDVVLGGGIGWKHQYGIENDEEFSNLIDEVKGTIKEEGYDLVETNKDMEKSNSNKLWGMFSDADLDYDFDRQADKTSTQPSVSEMTSKAIDVLNKNEKGFFLMVEGSKIDWAAHANNPVGMISDILAFDEAVKEAVEFAKKDGNTVVVVTTDHGNSGITIGTDAEGFSYSQALFEDTVELFSKAKITEETFKSLISGKTDADIVSLAKEYYGIDLTSEELQNIKENNNNINKVLSLRGKIGFTTGGHTGEDVYLGVYAPTTSKKLTGVVDNTEVNKYMQNMIFNEEKLESLTKELFNNIEDLDKSADTKLEKSEDDSAVVLVNEKTGKTLKLYTNTNKYELDGKVSELTTVMPLIKEKLYVSQEVAQLISTIEKVDNSGATNEESTNGGTINSGTSNEESINSVSTNNEITLNKKPSTITKTGALGAGLLTVGGAGLATVGGALLLRKKKDEEKGMEE